MSDNIKSLIEESSVSQLIITVMLLGLCGWVQLTQGTVPEWLKTAVLVLVGFYFGGKSVALTNKSADVMKQARRDATRAATAEATPAVAGVVTSTVTTTVDPEEQIATVETSSPSQAKPKRKAR